MSVWLTSDFGTIILSLILAVIVMASIISMVKKKKQGKTLCGCGCANCAIKGYCNIR